MKLWIKLRSPGAQQNHCVLHHFCAKTLTFAIFFLVSNAQREQKTPWFIRYKLGKKGSLFPTSKQFEKRPPDRTDLRQRTAPGWIYGFHFDDGGDGPQKLRVEWVSGNFLRGKTANPWEFYIYIFVAGGMNLNSWNFSLVFLEDELKGTLHLDVVDVIPESLLMIEILEM